MNKTDLHEAYIVINQLFEEDVGNVDVLLKTGFGVVEFKADLRIRCEMNDDIHICQCFSDGAVVCTVAQDELYILIA